MNSAVSDSLRKSRDKDTQMAMLALPSQALLEKTLPPYCLND